MPLIDSWCADRESFIWYIVCSSQNSFPQCRQLILPLLAFNGRPHTGSEHKSLGPGLCQCVLVTTSSGSRLSGSGGRAGCAFGVGDGVGETAGLLLDSKTSRPLSFWFKAAKG